MVLLSLSLSLSLRQIIDSIKNDPGFCGGEYAAHDPTDPWPGMVTAAGIQALVGAAPILWQEQCPTRLKVCADHSDHVSTLWRLATTETRITDLFFRFSVALQFS